AVVAVGARPEQGEGIVTGDVVNTASRLQGAAPVNGIAVSEQTYRQTERVFSYEELAPVQVKGKAEPLSIWRPLEAHSRFGTDVTRAHTTPSRRPGAGEAAADRDARALGAAALLPAGDDRRGAGRGQEPALRGTLPVPRGSPRPRPLAARALPALRGGNRLLGAWGDRQGRVRHPRVRLAGAGGVEAGAGLARGRPRPRLADGASCPPRRRRGRAGR